MDCIVNGVCRYDCPYHKWLREADGDRSCGIQKPDLLFSLNQFVRTGSTDVSQRLQQMGRLAKRRCTEDTQPGLTRLLAFLRLTDVFRSFSWASARFDVNESIYYRLIAAHLHLIAGKEEAKKERTTLLRYLSEYGSLETQNNLIWITNRQQGKTTTVSMFLAALSVCSVEGGLLATVYSTSLDRSCELLKGAKQFLYEYSGKHERLKFVRDTDRMYTLYNKAGATVEVSARPKNADSCRGDAPHAAFFDEIAFIQDSFWWKFAYPLLQITNRRFSLITTPPPPGNFFDVFTKQVQERNKQNDFFFTFINHSLTCERCLELGETAECCHQLHNVPPWKSILRIASMQRLVPKNRQAQYATEIMGVMAQQEAGYFPPEIVDACLTRIVDPPAHFKYIWCGVDPAGHSRSQLALTAVGVTHDGVHIILGIASVNVNRCEALQISSIVRVFSNKLLSKYPRSTIVPIVEVNGSEVLASTIVRAFGANIMMPFTKERFATYITDGVGVLTTKDTKMAYIQALYLALMDGRVCVSNDVVSVSRLAFDPRADVPDPGADVEELGLQLKRFSDKDDGTVSGKASGGLEDDIAMSLMITFYWRLAVLNSSTELQ